MPILLSVIGYLFVAQEMHELTGRWSTTVFTSSCFKHMKTIRGVNRIESKSAYGITQMVHCSDS